MRSPRRSLCTALVLVGAGILLSAAASAAQPDSTEASRRSIVELEVQIDGGDPFRVTVWEGQEATLRSPRHGLSLVLVPVVTDRVTGEVTFRLRELIGRHPDGLMTRAAGRVLTQIGFRQPLGHFPVHVEVLEVREPNSFELGQESAPELQNSDIIVRKKGPKVIPQGTCCVSCANGDELCGCCVRASCGSCSGGCCGGGIAK